jgi:EAL domain-containing protein (putative c-di-GMP-specific phosphodiesterase class I)
LLSTGQLLQSRIRAPDFAAMIRFTNPSTRRMSSQTTHWTDPVAYLRQALTLDQFTLYCQPIAALSGVVVYPMAEVLIRLREEETALLPPGEFLPILEHYGMMPELDRWVVREVVRRLSSGPEIARFCVNLSSQTIADPAFPDFFADEIHTNAVPADRVLFEIDESDALAVPSCMRRFSATVGSLGAGILIDGFGRAENHAACLKLPCIQYVKLHGSLTRRIAVDEAAEAKLKAVLRVLGEHGIAAVAECVEDDDVIACLKALKVRYAQGFGICVPQSIDLVSELPVMRFSPVQGNLDFGKPAKGRPWQNSSAFTAAPPPG